MYSYIYSLTKFGVDMLAGWPKLRVRILLAHDCSDMFKIFFCRSIYREPFSIDRCILIDLTRLWSFMW
jgi:hypothetical protein